jgi:hypothetical protein
LYRGCTYRLCHPNVLMMEAAEPTDRYDTPDCLRWSVERSILVERKMRADTIVVGQVIGQQITKVPFSQHDDMVETFASDRPDQPFNMTVLPRRAWRDRPISNTHHAEPALDRQTIGGVAVTDEVARCLIPWERFGDLPGDPLGGWIAVTLVQTSRRRSRRRMTSP